MWNYPAKSLKKLAKKNGQKVVDARNYCAIVLE